MEKLTAPKLRVRDLDEPALRVVHRVPLGEPATEPAMSGALVHQHPRSMKPTSGI